MGKWILTAALTLTGSVCAAVQVDVTCFAKRYDCVTQPNGVFCQWQTVPQPYEQNLQLEQDPNYPNAGYPYEVWRGRYSATYDNHALTLDIFYSTQDALHPLKVYANLNARTVMAETSGLDSIDIGLRNQNFGRGFLCSNFRITP